MKYSLILSLLTAQALSSTVSALRARRTQDNMRIVNDCRFCFRGVACLDSMQTPGRFVCQGCPLGYTGDGVRCTRRDECVEDKPCFPDEQGGFCVDMAPDQGRFSCGCRNGYDAIAFDPVLGHPIACQDRDECTLQEDDCDANVGICSNTPGSFQCSCPPGFDGDGKTCTEIPEQVVLTPCEMRNCDPVSSVCVLEDVGDGDQEAVCMCNPGYLQIGRNAACNDVNECLSNPCGENAQCFNQQGSFLCICDTGFTGNPMQGCGDADECSNGQNDCNRETEVCINIAAGFECVSQPSSSPTGTPTIAPTSQPTVRPQPALWRQLGQTVMGSDDSSFGERVALSADGRTLAVSAKSDIDPSNGSEIGSVTTYRLNGNTWTQLGGTIYGFDIFGEFAEFGEDMDISADGNTLVVGADCDSNRCQGVSQVAVFRFNGTEWDLGGFPILGIGVGGAVDISADGSIMVLTREDTQLVVIFAVDPDGDVREEPAPIQRIEGAGEEFSAFGSSVALSGDGLTVAIGSSQATNDVGDQVGSVSAYIFNPDSVDPETGESGMYELVQVLFGRGDFGHSVALSSDGSILAVGDNDGGDFGEVTAFRFQSGSWIQLGQTLMGDANAISFGDAVALNAAGNILTVSSHDGLGFVRAFRLVGNTWRQLGQRLAGQNEGGEFGSELSLSASGLVLAVGAEEDDAVRVFRFA